jgi:shikimate dehydrogenase
MEYGLIGEKLGHSYSKQIHARFADYSYELHPVAPEDLDFFMKARDFKGINVTIPYKRDVIAYLNCIDPLAEKIGAVNTIVNKNGMLTGYNTDYLGFMACLKYFRISLLGKKILCLGNGGVAKPIIAYAKDAGAKQIIIVKYKTEPGTVTYSEAASLHSDADIIINATPVGMYPDIDRSPISLEPYHNLSAVVDVIANPLETKLLKEASALGLKNAGGLFMLVAQAKYAAEYFLDKKISDDEIIPVYEYIKTLM